MICPSVKKYLIGSVLCLLILFSCTADTGKLYNIKINDVSLKIEIADTPEKRQKGLMYRKSLPDHRGMLFIFEQEQKLSFWMKNTEIPLSIAYISKSGIIREIHNLEPQSQKPVQSRHSVLYALEVNRDYFKENGIKTGDRVQFFF